MSTQMVPQNGSAGKADVTVGSRGVVLTSLDELYRFAKAVALSGLAPKGMEKPETVLVAIQLGMELGLSPMSALQNIGVINGKPGVYGDAAKALCEDSGLMEDFDEWYEVGGKRVDKLPPDPAKWADDLAAACLSKRRGRKPLVTTFSVGDAKRAKLWDRDGPWKQYPSRMLKFRARGFNLRDNFPDVLKGLKTTEEIQDYPAGPRTVQATVRPAGRLPAPEAAPETDEHGEIVGAGAEAPPAPLPPEDRDEFDELSRRVLELVETTGTDFVTLAAGLRKHYGFETQEGDELEDAVGRLSLEQLRDLEQRLSKKKPAAAPAEAK